MRVLFAGNSQVACLKKAHDLHPDILGKHAKISFYVTPGGTGPYLSLNNKQLVANLSAMNPKFPPRVYPEEAAQKPVSHYDAIVISALGYLDGGFYYPSPVPRQGLLSDFAPKQNTISNRPLSKTCYRHIIHNTLTSHQGFQFLTQLRKCYSKRIIVQPFPLMSDIIRDHPKWPLNQMYDKPLEVNEFFCKTRDAYLAKLCSDLNVELLPYPQQEWHEKFFTPAEFMNTADGMHPTELHGKMIIEQIAKLIS